MHSIVFIAVFMIILTSCSPTARIATISEVKIYKKFLRNGTTNNIINAFDFPNKYNVDTSLNEFYKVDKINFDNALKNARVRKHFQQKNGGITFAGEFVEQSRKHFFAYFESANLIIDFTDKRNYWLNRKLN